MAPAVDKRSVAKPVTTFSFDYLFYNVLTEMPREKREIMERKEIVVGILAQREQEGRQKGRQEMLEKHALSLLENGASLELIEKSLEVSEAWILDLEKRKREKENAPARKAS
jgi:predicted transposase YdaD